MSQNDSMVKRILISRTDRIGDLVLTLPLAAALKHKFPQCHITFLVRLYTAEIVRNCSFVDEVLICPEIDGKIQTTLLINELKTRQFSTVFHVYPQKEVAWASFRAGIPDRIGTAYRWFSFLFNRKVRDHRKEVHFHELEYNLRMAKAIGLDLPVSPETVMYGLQVPEKVIAEVEIPIQVLDSTKSIIIVHPGSGGSAVDLPEEKFIELVAKLTATEKYTVIVTGGKNEVDLCTRVVGNTDAVNAAGKLNLLQLMVIIQKCNIFVSNSTGPLHIAAGLGKNVVGFYPKIKTCSPQRWAPYTANRAVFVPTIGCNDCTREQCGRLHCMNSIDINNVIEQIEKFHR